MASDPPGSFIAHQRRSCYINFAEHLLNAFNPNMANPGLPNRWSDEDWAAFIDMIADMGFNCFEFWLTPRLFSPSGLTQEWGHAFARWTRTLIQHAHSRQVAVKMLCALDCVGDDWRTYCPHDTEQWKQLRHLWDAWTKQLPGLGVVGIFPGDPGGCSRNGCTAMTFIDRAMEIASLVKRNLPEAHIELGTWGPPFFGWGNIQGPPNWQGEFLPHIQGTAWTFDKGRADQSMHHLLRRLPQFPQDTSVAINLGFNPDGDPEAQQGLQDARGWAREIARIRPIVSWDFSLTEGENAVLPHYRFDRLYAQRQREREAAPYSGGICFTMTPLLNQLSLYQSAQSFLAGDPAGVDHHKLTQGFFERLFGPRAVELDKALPLFEIIPDWGNLTGMEISRRQYHRCMVEGAELLRELKSSVRSDVAFHPSPERYRQSLLFFFELFADLTGESPDFDALGRRYWQEVYAIYDQLPGHVDPRPQSATRKIAGYFDSRQERAALGPLPRTWLSP